MASDNAAIGQADLDDFTHQSNMWQFIMRQLIARISTMKLVQVKAVNGGGAGAVAAAGTVNVMPLVNQIDGNGNSTPHGIVNGIPWWRLQGGTGAVICDPKVGDLGMVLCADRDSSSVIRTKAQANPGSRRKYDLADGIYVGSILGMTPTQYLDFVDAGGIKLVDSLGNQVVMSGSGIALTPKSGQPINLNGPTNVNGAFHVVGGANNATFDGNVSIAGNETITGTAGITGAATVGGTLDVTGAITSHASIGLFGGGKITRINTGSVNVSFSTGIGLSSGVAGPVSIAGVQAGDFAIFNNTGGASLQGISWQLQTVSGGVQMLWYNGTSGVTYTPTWQGNLLVIGTT